MLFSRLLIPTLKETPAEAEVVSHQLLLRAGMIRKLAAGIYTYLPLGLRALRKVEQIVREEMDRAGAQEVLDARGAAGGAVAGVRPLAGLRQGAAALQGPPRPGLLLRPDPRGSHHRPGAPGGQLLPAAADQPLPDPDEVPGRDPAPLRPDARPGVHHEGRLQLRRGRNRRRSLLPPMYDAYNRIFSRCGLRFGGRGGHRHHRRQLLPRVHGPGGDRRGPVGVVHGLRLCRQPGEGRSGSGAGRGRPAGGRRPGVGAHPQRAHRGGSGGLSQGDARRHRQDPDL